MNDFFTLISSPEFHAQIHGFTPMAPMAVPLQAARSQVLAEDIVCTDPLPPWPRSTMDGFAVRAADTFGCSESETALLTIAGEIAMGAPGSQLTLKPGQAARIWTGGELPHKADAVVMIEYTQLFDAATVAVYRPVAPGENVIKAGDDYASGSTVLAKGHRLRPQDLGVLAGLGRTQARVQAQPRVAILSTGDELVPVDQEPSPGQIRDINSTTLAALVEEAGGIPVPLGICGDNFDRILAICQDGLAQADMLLLSGGSSVGQRDFTLRVFQAMAQTKVLVHGVAIRPGKPTILARQENKPLFGLPGHVASAMVVFYLFVRPMIRLLSGLSPDMGLQTLTATTTQPIPSAIGREEYVRVQLTAQNNAFLATPVYGKSGLLNPLVRAGGLLVVGRDAEGLDQGAEATVLLFPGFETPMSMAAI